LPPCDRLDKKLVVVGYRKALAIAVRYNQAERRLSELLARFQAAN
jgi:hypothetical protein